MGSPIRSCQLLTGTWLRGRVARTLALDQARVAPRPDRGEGPTARGQTWAPCPAYSHEYARPPPPGGRVGGAPRALSPATRRLGKSAQQVAARYKVPEQIDLRGDPLPTSGPGTVLKRELRAPFWVGPHGAGPLDTSSGDPSRRTGGPIPHIVGFAYVPPSA